MSHIAPAARKLCEGISSRDHALVKAQLAPDASWTIVGRADRFPYGGTRGREEMLQFLVDSLTPFESFSFDVLAAAQAGCTVFVEAKASGIGAKGAPYDNRYLMRLTLAESGLVRDVLEHYDPFEALVYVDEVAAREAR